MKKFLSMLCVFALLFLCGCGKTTSSESTSPESPTSSSTTQSTPSQGVPWQIVQMEKINALFGELGGWYNATLTCEYRNVYEINLRAFFGLGFADQSQTPTDAEWAELENQPGFDANLNLFRLPAAQMDAVLTQYFGVTLEELDESCFEGLIYLESTDCYYFMATGSSAIDGFAVTEIRVGNGAWIWVDYTSDSGISGTVVLIQVEDQYQVISNQYTTD